MARLTRKRIKVTEQWAVEAWPQLVGREMTCEGGERLRLVYPGRVNGGVGPDFLDAVIVMDEAALVKGDVEVHVRSSDWYRHGHYQDPEYDRVIVHVVVENDGESTTLRRDGGSIPVLSLSRGLSPVAGGHLPCSQTREHKSEESLKRLLEAAGEERFRNKAKSFRVELARGEARQVLWKSVSRALGYSRNSRPFEELACRLPLKFLEKLESHGGLLLEQAWLLGMAGLLPCQRSEGVFLGEQEAGQLERIWHSVGDGARAMSENDWHFGHIYPNNSPVRRVIAQSYVLQRYRTDGLLGGLLQLIRETPLVVGYRRLEDGLTVLGDGYWQEHRDFGRKTKRAALLGRSKAGEIAVNVLLPFGYAWGEASKEPELEEKAIQLYASYPRLAENAITRHMVRQLCLEDMSDSTARRQQGLIHIFRNYCREGNCSRCLVVNRG